MEEFEDTKGVIIIRKSEKNRQHNGQMKKYKRTKQRSIKHTYKTKDILVVNIWFECSRKNLEILKSRDQ